MTTRTVAPGRRRPARPRATAAAWLRRHRRLLRDGWPSLAALAVLAVVMTRMAFDAGGYFPAAFLAAAVPVFGALAVLLAVRVPRHRLSTEALVGLAALAGLVGWMGLSTAWSPDPDAGRIEFERGLLYVGLFALGLLAAGSGRYSRHVMWAMLAVTSVVVLTGLASRLAPGVVEGIPDVPQLTGYRLSHPLGYWNAFGALAAMGAVLALGLAGEPRTRVPLRAAAAGLAVLLAVAMYLSLSRGAWLSLFAGLAVLLVLSSHRASLLMSGGLVGVATALAVARLAGYPALVDDPAAGAGQAAAGEAFLPQLALLVGAVVAAQAVVAAGRASPLVMSNLRRVARPVAIASGIVLALAVAGAYAVRGADAEGRVAQALTDAEGWVDRQWDDFLQPSQYSETGTARLTTSRGTRSDLWRTAFDGFQASPLRGDGAGGFEVRWMRTREVGEEVRDAHSLGFEVLGELGLVGGLLLLAFLGAVIFAVLRARLRPTALPRSQVAAIGATCTVFIVHASVDWDWQMPAVAGVALVLSAAVFPEGRRRRRRRRPA